MFNSKHNVEEEKMRIVMKWRLPDASKELFGKEGEKGIKMWKRRKKQIKLDHMIGYSLFNWCVECWSKLNVL